MDYAYIAIETILGILNKDIYFKYKILIQAKLNTGLLRNTTNNTLETHLNHCVEYSGAYMGGIWVHFR